MYEPVTCFTLRTDNILYTLSMLGWRCPAMPMKELSVPDQRLFFVRLIQDEGLSLTEACRTCQISRPTGYKILERFQQEGVAGLSDRSRAPHHPQTIVPELTDRILAAKAKHPTWGPKKIRAALSQQEPLICWPATSTVGEILKRAGLVRPRRRHTRCPRIKVQPWETKPNSLWCMDYKGQFQLGDGQWCYPLTITDQQTRFLIRCQALANTAGQNAWPYFVGAFQEFGLPDCIRSDNGSPFANASITGLTHLSLKLLKLGILLERIDPGKPQQNGTHERMHRTLKEEAASPASPQMTAQQHRFDAWRQIYTHERPHEALKMQTPASCYQASLRPYPVCLPPLNYPEGMKVMRVRPNGCIRLRGKELFVSEVLTGEPIGLDPFANELCALYVGIFPLLILNEAALQFLPDDKASEHLEPLRRQIVRPA